MKQLADDVSVTSALRIPGLVNLNTAPREVLEPISGLNEELADAIISHRRHRGWFTSVGELLDVPGITNEVFKSVSRRVTTRSGTFRILSEGQVDSTGARQRIETVVRMSYAGFDTLAYRTDS